MSIEYTEVLAAIGANRFTETVDYYRTLFNREPDERIRDIYVGFRLPGIHLGIFVPGAGNRGDFENHVDLRSGLNLVVCVADVEQARNEIQLREPQHKPGEIRETAHGREFYAYDPEGNRLIIVERTSAK